MVTTGRARIAESIKSAVLVVLAVLTLSATGAVAQNYNTSDTITEYPNHGTYYHDRFEGRKTASGEIFDQNKFTAAHWKIKLGTYVMVTNRNNGLQVIVKVNDRCPKRGVFDLSHRAATAIGIRGSQPVTVRILPPGYENQWAAQESLFDSVYSPRHPAPTAAPVKKSATTSASKGVTRPIPVFDITDTQQGSYRLTFGTVASHSEAYTVINRLPEAYRSHTLVEPSEADDSLTLSLDLRLNKQQAETLRKALADDLPSVRVTPCK